MTVRDHYFSAAPLICPKRRLYILASFPAIYSSHLNNQLNTTTLIPLSTIQNLVNCLSSYLIHCCVHHSVEDTFTYKLLSVSESMRYEKPFQYDLI